MVIIVKNYQKQNIIWVSGFWKCRLFDVSDKMLTTYSAPRTLRKLCSVNLEHCIRSTLDIMYSTPYSVCGGDNLFAIVG